MRHAEGCYGCFSDQLLIQWYLRIRRTTTVTLKESMPVASLYSWYGLHDGNSGHDMVWANPTMLVTMVTSRYFH